MTASFFISFDFHKLVRVWLLAMVLTVGALQVSRCTESDDPAEAARDQYDRMYNFLPSGGLSLADAYEVAK